MKVFISWSGSRSRAVAAALREWLKLVIQGSEPWMSEKDIKAGQQWRQEVGEGLDEADFGIVCLTPENVGEPWLNFEAGALSKRVKGKEARVAGYLLEMGPGQVEGPLTAFQLKEATAEGTRAVVESINGLTSPPLSENLLKATFEKWWPDLKGKLEGIGPAAQPKASARTPGEMLEEVVETTRRIEAALNENATRWQPLPPATPVAPMPGYVPDQAAFAEAVREQQLRSRTGVGQVARAGSLDVFSPPGVEPPKAG